MLQDRDHFEAYYADKLWRLIPAVYRAEDSPDPDRPGPLREMVNRMGAQAAVLRRAIDRTWEDQSIETSDDWLIPYLGDLVGTNLVGGLDARGQRLDVAKTIYYRRRKGTVALLEELAVDVTGWEARVVEFFRRLGRSRHNLDPPIGFPATPGQLEPWALQEAQGLVGPRTRTPLGGTADLRNAHGATLSRTAFDEFAHTLDVRRGRGLTGWHAIPRLGVFLWRLRSFEIGDRRPDGTTPPDDVANPVRVSGCPGRFVFDPTGRCIPLFAHPVRTRDTYRDAWVSTEEWELPTPIRNSLWDDETYRWRDEELPPASPPPAESRLYPTSLAVHHLGTLRPLFDPAALPGDPAAIEVFPEIGWFDLGHDVPVEELRVNYHYGFAAEIGAGPYDRRLGGGPAVPLLDPETAVKGGNASLNTLPPVIARALITIDDSLTYTEVPNLSVATRLTIRGGREDSKRRPLIRLAAGERWELTGLHAQSELALDGIFLSGGDIVLRGQFRRVLIRCCTFDPGDAGKVAPPGCPFPPGVAADGRPLTPTRLFVEGEIAELVVSRSILGPIRTRLDGSISGRLCIADSIVQSVAPAAGPVLEEPEGTAVLERVTLLGPARLRRLEASEAILDGVVTVADTQHGCVRFSAWVTGSTLPRQYESVEIAPDAPLFNSRIFGRPDFAQLSATADAAIRGGTPEVSILTGAANGSEMGAFSREQEPIKERGLLIKYREFVPLGLDPVVIHVT